MTKEPSVTFLNLSDYHPSDTKSTISTYKLSCLIYNCQREKDLRLLVLGTCVTLLKRTELPWDEDALIAAISKILNSVATAFKGYRKNSKLLGTNSCHNYPNIIKQFFNCRVNDVDRMTNSVYPNQIAP